MGDPAADEDEKERTQRQLLELLNELRVVIPGVQVLFAFLLTIPFNQRFAEVSDFQQTVYFVTLLLSALATALFLAPTGSHRGAWRERRACARPRLTPRRTTRRPRAAGA